MGSLLASEQTRHDKTMQSWPVQSLPLASQSAVSHVAAHLAAAAAGIATEHIVVGPAADHTVQIAHKAKDLPVAVQHMRHRRSLNTLQGIAGASAPPAAAHQHLHLHMQAVGTALAAHSMVAARCTAHTSGAALGFPSTPTIQFDPKNWQERVTVDNLERKATIDITGAWPVESECSSCWG